MAFLFFPQERDQFTYDYQLNKCLDRCSNFIQTLTLTSQPGKLNFDQISNGTARVQSLYLQFANMFVNTDDILKFDPTKQQNYYPNNSLSVVTSSDYVLKTKTLGQAARDANYYDKM